jgi:hypothetical protein
MPSSSSGRMDTQLLSSLWRDSAAVDERFASYRLILYPLRQAPAILPLIDEIALGNDHEGEGGVWIERGELPARAIWSDSQKGVKVCKGVRPNEHRVLYFSPCIQRFSRESEPRRHSSP